MLAVLATLSQSYNALKKACTRQAVRRLAKAQEEDLEDPRKGKSRRDANICRLSLFCIGVQFTNI